MLKKITLGSVCVFFLLSIATIGFAKDGINKSKKIVNIAGFDSTTGKYGNYGVGDKRGQDIAVEEINSKGGIQSGPLKGYKLKLDFNDDKGDPQEAANIARKISAGNYLVALGPTMSSSALAASPVFYRNQVPNIITYAQANTITEQGFNNLVRLTYTTKSVALHMAQQIKDHFHMGSVSIISENGAYGQQLLKTFKEKAKELGIKVASESVIVPGQDVDFKSVLLLAKSKKPDMLVIFVTYNEGGMLVKQCRKMGWDVPIYGPNSLTEPKFFNLAGKLGKFYLVLAPTLDMTRPAAKKFVALWHKRYKGMPSMSAIYGYDAVRVAEKVIEMGGIDRESFIKKMKKVRANGLANPVYEFGKTGEVKSPALITMSGEEYVKKNLK